MMNIEGVLEDYKDRYGLRAIARGIAERVSGHQSGGVTYTSLAGQFNPYSPQQFQARYIVPLIQTTGDMSLLHRIASALHCVVLPLPEKNSDGHSGLGHSIASTSKDFSEALSACVEAWEDGEIDERERVRCRKEVYELIHSASLLLGKLNRTAQVQKRAA